MAVIEKRLVHCTSIEEARLLCVERAASATIHQSNALWALNAHVNFISILA